MSKDQLDVFLVAYTGDTFIQWANQLDIYLGDDVNPAGKFLRKVAESNRSFRKRESALVLYLMNTEILRASIGFYADITPDDERPHRQRKLRLEGLMSLDEMERWGKDFQMPADSKLDFVDCLLRAYDYLDADLHFMDYPRTEEEKHRIIMPYDSYAKIQQIGRSIDNSPFLVMMGVGDREIKLVPFNVDVMRNHLKPTADYHPD